MKKVSTGFLSLCLIASFAYAMGAQPSFSDVDANKDGKVTQEEFSMFQASQMEKNANAGKALRNAGNAPQFEDIDTNKDGSVSAEEMTQSYEKRRKAMQGSKGAGNGYKN